MKKICEILKKPLSIYMIVLFIFTFLFSILIPYGGDDWNNYLYKGASILDAFKEAKLSYFNYEGRFFSRIFDILLVPNQFLWALINATLMMILYYMMVKILNVKQTKLLLPLLLMAILFVDIQTYAQVYVWKTGNITYFIPMVFAMFLIYVRRNLFNEDDVILRKTDYLLIPLTFIFSMFVETLSVGIVMVCLLNLVFYFMRYRKIDKAMLLCLIVAVAGLIFMIFSPGTMSRLADNTEFASLSFIGKLIYNIPNLITFTFIKNSFLLLLMGIVMVLILRGIKNKIVKILGLIYISIIPILTVCVNLFSYTGKEITRPFHVLLDASRWYVSLYWIIFAVMFLLLIFFAFANHNKKKTLYFIILAMVGNGAMMISPIWGGRTACLTTFMLYIVVFYVFFNMNLKIYENRKINIILNAIVIIFMLLFTVYSIWIYKLNLDRNKYINYQIENGASKYEIIILPSYFTWNLNTWGSDGDFAYKFKAAYGMKEDAELIYIKRDDVKINLDRINNSSKIGE